MIAPWIKQGLRHVSRSVQRTGLREATKVAGTYPHPPENIAVAVTVQPGDYVLSFDLPADETLNFHRKVQKFTAVGRMDQSSDFIPVGEQLDPEARTISVFTDELGASAWVFRIRAENAQGYVESKDFRIIV
jgi:hypothetical protein